MENREVINWLTRIRDRLMTTSSKQFEAITMAISALEKQEQDRWIPVTERLPETSGLYTVTDMTGNVVRYIFTGTDSSKRYWKRNAIAWRPLPEPYTEEES